MSASAMGRRYERLLFMAGPLALACLLVLFVALASDEHKDRRDSQCLKGQLEVLDANRATLEIAYAEKGRSSGKYWLALRNVLIPWEVSNPSCAHVIANMPQDFKPESPQALIGRLRAEASALASKPISFYGVDLPEKASLNVLGAQMKVELLTLVRIMQVVLGPVLLLWLGCLYNTRHRETLYIARMADVTQLYPHLINVYPLGWREGGTSKFPRKKGWLVYGLDRYGTPTSYAIVRMMLLSAFVGPPVAFYTFSLFRLALGPTPYAGSFVATGALVLVFALGSAMCELLPWHLNKRFLVNRPFVT